MKTSLWIIISVSIVIFAGSSIYYFYMPQPISTQVRPFYLVDTMTEYFTKNESGFDSVQLTYNKYLNPTNATISIMANGPHKFTNCDIIYQSNGSNKVLSHYENITNRGEGLYDDPNRILDSTNRLKFECNNPYYSLSWPYLTLKGIVASANTVSLNGRFEPGSNIMMSIYSCTITGCDYEERHSIVDKSMLVNQDGNFSYSFMIPQTSDNLLYLDLKMGNKEYVIGTRMNTS